MANKEHLEKLKEAIEKKDIRIWNKWREENPDTIPDLTDADLSEAVFSTSGPRSDPAGVGVLRIGYDMANLSGANLKGANLAKSYLPATILSGANLFKAKLEGANLLESDITNADVREAVFTGANLTEADLTDSDLTKADFSEADLSRAYLLKTDLIETDFSNSRMVGAHLAGADLIKANLTRVDLSGADLSGANITGAILVEANITQACVSYLEYNRKEMRGCYLGIRGTDSCYGNALFRRDAQDQDYLDALKGGYRQGWRRILLFWLWSLTDFGRSMSRVGGFALFLVVVFGTIYRQFPCLVDYGKPTQTWFTPYYFSFVTYTTLGFGDVTAGCLAGEILVALEVVLGYLTLGFLLAILANTVARRS